MFFSFLFLMYFYYRVKATGLKLPNIASSFKNYQLLQVLPEKKRIIFPINELFNFELFKLW